MQAFSITKTLIVNFAILAGACAGQSTYQVSGLPLPDGGTFGIAFRINDAGLVLGYTTPPPGSTDPSVSWLNGQLQPFPQLDGVSFLANGVGSGNVVAGLLVEGDGVPAIFRDGAYTTLPDPLPAPAHALEVRAINSQEIAVGSAANAVSHVQAVTWSNGSGTFLDIDPTHQSIANDINDSGAIVGVTAFADNSTHVTLWENGQTRYLDEIPGSPGEFQGRINNRGQVVVNTGFPGPGDDITPPYEWDNETVTPLQPLPGADNTLVGGLNDSGVAVGFSGTEAITEAVEWINGIPTDLNSLIDPNSGWHLSAAADINNLGQIVGRGELNGETLPFVLTPTSTVPEPMSLAFFAIGAALLCRRQGLQRSFRQGNGSRE